MGCRFVQAGEAAWFLVVEPVNRAPGPGYARRLIPHILVLLVQAMRPARNEIIICTGPSIKGAGVQYRGSPATACSAERRSPKDIRWPWRAGCDRRASGPAECQETTRASLAVRRRLTASIASAVPSCSVPSHRSQGM